MIPQSFLNGLRTSAASAGMGDTRGSTARSLDQTRLGASGSPGLVYNNPGRTGAPTTIPARSMMGNVQGGPQAGAPMTIPTAQPWANVQGGVSGRPVTMPVNQMQQQLQQVQGMPQQNGAQQFNAQQLPRYNGQPVANPVQQMPMNNSTQLGAIQQQQALQNAGLANQGSYIPSYMGNRPQNRFYQQ